MLYFQSILYVDVLYVFGKQLNEQISDVVYKSVGYGYFGDIVEYRGS